MSTKAMSSAKKDMLQQRRASTKAQGHVLFHRAKPVNEAKRSEAECALRPSGKHKAKPVNEAERSGAECALRPSGKHKAKPMNEAKRSEAECALHPPKKQKKRQLKEHYVKDYAFSEKG